VVIGIGGRVDVGLIIEEDGIVWAEGGALEAVEEDIRNRVRELFAAVSVKMDAETSSSHIERVAFGVIERHWSRFLRYVRIFFPFANSAPPYSDSPVPAHV
jgi:hypothetical protein